MKAKHQRLTLALLALAAVIGAGVLALSALKDQAAFFYAPSDVVKDGLLELYEGGIEGTLEDGNLGINDFLLARSGTFYASDGLRRRSYPVIDGSGDDLEDVANAMADIINNGTY